MDNLPLELIRPIIDHLDDDSQSLLSVSLVSRLLRGEAQRSLFRTMALPTAKEAQVKFLTVIVSSRLLANLVEEFQQLDLVDAEDQQEPLWGLTCRGLQAMVNLKCLLFRSLNRRPSAQILHGCTFQLQILRWGNYHDAEQLLEFLSTQPQLRSLGVMWPIGPELDTSGICPGLQVLHGNNRIVDAFIPGRRIISLKWSPALEELRIYSPVYIPPQEFHHLRYFSYGGYAGRPLLRTLLPHLPRLEVLELIGLQCVEELVMLSEIPMLRVFILSNRSRTGWRALLSLREREAYFPQVFTACDILQHIDINIEALKYQRWFRDGSPNRPVFEVNEVLLPSWNIS